ncbi:unnamed protein product [Acanthoscelides obtectus]|uniref:E3 ubiquitin-protein ligase CHFR n=1 Tax=Acanthoscelides obtectus TaxID=200917 RepID=A0A9P0P2K0_ACAOB|nr:unnamed protein product [Acanthoscelides obtectus]CAK1639029.1 E3 ubiquitin-protein ligase rnf8-A [Acanthoscelides obtectus]
MNDLEVPKLKHTNGNTISINENPFVIGRALNCNYVIPNAQISRHHCSIEKADGDWFFRDISTNGCYLNGVLVKKDQKPLSDNDVIALCLDGSYDFTFQTSQSRDTSISDEQLNMVADSLDTVLSQTETSTVPISKTPSIPINERPVSSGASSPKRSRIELAASINHEPITTGVNEVEVTTVPISEISSVSVQHVSVISVPDTSPSPKTYRLALSSSVNNVDNTSNIVPSTATLPICDNPEINLQNTSTISDTNTLPVPIEIIQPSSSVEKPEESIIIPPLPEQQYEEMEDEMMCSICSDMFFKAVTLNCAHTFCKYCIEKWKKNRNICPICRAKITTMNATLVLDNVIQKVTDIQLYFCNLFLEKIFVCHSL